MGNPIDEHRLKKGERFLKKGELRELRRMNQARGLLATSLGQHSEEMAKFICQELQQVGSIENFWLIPNYSILDRQGIDIICKTPKGYFLFNVKKSSSGVSSFERTRERLQKNNIQILPIYPWRVTLEVNKIQEARTELEVMLSGDPSFSGDSLPEDIKKELENPTYPLKKMVENRIKEEPPATPRDRLNRLKKDGLVKNLRLERKKVWRVCLAATVNNSPIEIIEYGQNEEAEEKAYERLLNAVNKIK